MRVFIKPFLWYGNSYKLQKLDSPGICLFSGNTAMGCYCFAYLITCCENRVERGMRILEDHGDPVAPYVLQFANRKLKQIFFTEHDLPASNPSWMLDQAEYCKCGNCLA